MFGGLFNYVSSLCHEGKSSDYNSNLLLSYDTLFKFDDLSKSGIE